MAITLGGALSLTVHAKGSVTAGTKVQTAATCGITSNQAFTYEPETFKDVNGSDVSGCRITFSPGRPTATVWLVAQNVAAINTLIGSVVVP